MKNLKLKMLSMFAVLMIMSVALQAQTNRIVLTVKDNVLIKIAARNQYNSTPVTVISGDSTYSFTATTSASLTYRNFKSNGTTMTIFGDITHFYCEENYANITGVNTSGHTKLEALLCEYNAITNLNVSGTTLLKTIYCYENQLTSIDISTLANLEQIAFRNNNVSSLDISANNLLNFISFRDNNFTTQTLNDLYCALQDRTSLTSGKIYPTGSPTSSNYPIVIASAGSNATAKNWKVLHGSDDTNVPTTGSYTCPTPSANMNRYIKLNVKQGTNIKLSFAGEQPNTRVLVRSGASETLVTVGTNWNSVANYYAAADTMAIFGNVSLFGCEDNTTNITGINFDKNLNLVQVYCSNNSISNIDVRNLYKLQYLSFFKNNLSVEKIDAIYCNAIDRTGLTQGKFVPFYSSADPNYATLLYGMNKYNAIDKNWKVQFFNGTDIPSTNGTYSCPGTSRYIELDVVNGQQIALNMKAGANNTGVRVLSGTTDTTFVVGQTFTGIKNYTAGDSKMIIYGNLTEFDCRSNSSKITAINVSNNTGLIRLLTSWNNISALDVTKLVSLKELYCIGDNLNNIDVSKCLDLEALSCHYNNLNTIDVTKNTKLIHFYCDNNSLTSLNLANNFSLLNLGCNNNSIDSLDISGNPYLQNVKCENNSMKFLKVDKFGALKSLSCYGNDFTAQVIDSIYCSLPTRNVSDNASIYPLYSNASSNYSTVIKTNGQNAKSKNWTVKYKVDENEVSTNGTYICGDPFLTTSATTIDASEITYNSAKLNGSCVFGTYDVVSEKGFEWKKTSGGTYSKLNVPLNEPLNVYLTNLDPNTSHTFRAYVKVEASYIYGEEKTFKTLQAPIPATVTTNPATDITYASAVLNAVVDPGTDVIGEKGFEWKKTDAGSYTDLTSSSTGNTFNANLIGLTENTGYTFRAYVMVGTEKKYGSELTFTTAEMPEVNMNRYIELTVKQGEGIWLSCMVDAANTGVKVVSGAYDTTIVVGTSGSGFIKCNADANTMKVYGNVNEFICSNNNANVTGLDVSNNKELKILYCETNNISVLDMTNLAVLEVLSCYSNNISTIKVAGCDKLFSIDCSGNQLSACGLDSLFHQLPIRPAESKGDIMIRDGNAYDNPGALTCRDTIATNRNWNVWDYVTLVVNTTYACPDFSIIEEMAANSLEINIYPNPVNDNLNIECGERINNLELYDAIGRMLIRKTNVLDNVSIDVSNIESGMYILKIRTEKGSGEYKVIVE